jgi:hypothetical protein
VTIEKFQYDRMALSERTLATWSEMRASGASLVEHLRLIDNEIAFLRRHEGSGDVAILLARWETLASQIRGGANSRAK